MSWTPARARSTGVGLQQRLLGGDIERRDLGDAVDQCLVVELCDRVPVDRIAEASANGSRFAFQRGALDRAPGCRDRPRSTLEQFGLDLAERRRDVEFARDAEAGFAGQDDVEAAVVQRLDLGDPAEAADLE